MRFGLPTLDRHTLMDLAAVGISALMGAALARTVSADSPVPAPAVLAVCLLLSATLLWRRTHPLAVLWAATATGAAAIATALATGPLFSADTASTLAWFPPTAPFAAYSAALHTPPDRRFWLPFAALVGVCLLATDPTSISGTGVRTVLFVDLAAAVALYLSTHRRLVQALRERAQRAENEQHLLAQQARADERARLATEMHDIVTHRVSLIVLQAGALRVSAHDETVRNAAEELRVTGHRALSELRDLTGVLSQGHDPSGMSDLPAPGLSDPDPHQLVQDTRRTGTTVDLHTQGDPALASPLVAATLHRLVQESLTNVHKHAPGARVQVRTHYAPTAVRVSVTNTAPTRTPDPALVSSGSGRGLAGLRRRVELLGGLLSAAPTPEGGFDVSARLPAHVPLNAHIHQPSP
ncbi:sensor histidine kinase [Nocardiopsis valliformis]|uniref:sensor histidine kinase n=1 Tax=Nocardiopsis valliformis TaxID=239974 RepID=UPI00034B20CB|nr:histidine kinase [Nocardiopsis valliformis]